MNKQQRVLIIEDNRGISTKYQFFLQQAGYKVDIASTKPEALEKIRCRTYHVALVDIMLSDDETDRGGLDCIDYILKLKEGTCAIVLSASQDVRVPKYSFEKGAIAYLIKDDIRTSEDIISKVVEVAKVCQIKFYGTFANIRAYLSHPENTMLFEDRLMKAFQAGFDKSSELLDRLFEPLIPVLRPRQMTVPLRIDHLAGSLIGHVWSKALGAPVWISHTNTDNAALQLPPQEYGPWEEVYTFEGKNWPGVAKVWRVTRPRDDFEDSTLVTRQ